MSLINTLAKRHDMEPDKFQRVIQKTCMPSGAGLEEFGAFLMVASKYDLNPITREIYAFPAKGGGIQVIVGVDGWLKITNSHPQFDGMEFKDHLDADGKLYAVTCKIYRKDRAYPTECTEYLAECKRNSEPWNKWPSRMLRHKAMIQCARYAFSFSGIMEPDEAERAQEVDITERATVEPAETKTEAVKERLRAKQEEPEVIEAEPEPERKSRLTYAQLAEMLKGAQTVDDVEAIRGSVETNIKAKDQRAELFAECDSKHQQLVDCAEDVSF